MELSQCTPQFWIDNEDICKERLQENAAWDSVPLLNTNELHNLRDQSLVRFRGMIQDMYDPEYYYEKYEIENQQTNKKYTKSGKYADTTNLSEHEKIIYSSDINITSERHTLVVISIPALNLWVEKSEQKHEQPNSVEESLHKSIKRQMEDEDMETESAAVNGETDNNKRLCTNKQSVPNNVVSQDHILNFPLPGEKGKCCHVKVYQDSDKVKLNNMLDIMGFLSLDPVMAEPIGDQEFENSMEIQTHNPPPSLVPRIHCVAFKKIEHCNPLAKQIALDTSEFSGLKDELSIALIQLLLGDKLAADYLICHLLSSIYLRKEILALGKFSLNISNVPAIKYPNYVKDIYDILELLITKSHYVAMTLDNMNSCTFVPKKDYECNRLTSGLLQLSDNTHLVLDETKMQPGQLNSCACQGLAAISHVIQMQKAQYDFQYYQMEFDCDIPFLVFSEGKSLLPCDYHVSLKPDNNCMDTFPEIQEAAKHFLKPELLNKLRVYLTAARNLQYEISEGMLELVQNEFVEMRQVEKATPDDLHQLLVLTRLLCLSRGNSQLDQECWNHARSMEKERKSRLLNRTIQK